MEQVLEFGRVLPAGDALTPTARNAALGETIRAVAAGEQDAFTRLYADYWLANPLSINLADALSKTNASSFAP